MASIDNIFLRWSCLFLAQVIVEVLFVLYWYSVESRRPVLAGVNGAACYFFNALCVLAFVSQGWNLIPLGAGVFFGIWIVIFVKRKYEYFEKKTRCRSRAPTIWDS